MKGRWRLPACLVLCGLLLWLLADAAGVRASVEEALSLCAHSVVPALFPFLVVTSALLSLGFGELAAPWLAADGAALPHPRGRQRGLGAGPGRRLSHRRATAAGCTRRAWYPRRKASGC